MSELIPKNQLAGLYKMNTFDVLSIKCRKSRPWQSCCLCFDQYLGTGSNKMVKIDQISNHLVMLKMKIVRKQIQNPGVHFRWSFLQNIEHLKVINVFIKGSIFDA